MSLEWYNDFLNKVSDPPGWSEPQEQVLIEPYTYLAAIPGKEFRSALTAAFNVWMNVAKDDLDIVKKVVGMLHTASLLMDDVEDDSHLRRGLPVAHKIYGIPQTINSANYVYFLAYQELQRIHPRPGEKIEEMVTQELLNLHRGQGMDLFWRENLICPTEPEYIDMVNNKTGGLFRIAIKLMMAASPESPPRNYVPLANLIGIIFQIRDDYVNLQSVEYANNKGYCEDFSEGKFSFPIVHAIRADQSNRQILNILRERPSSPGPKQYAVSYMDTKTHSFAYTREVLRSLTRQAREEVHRLGGNEGVEEILRRLEVPEPDEAHEDGLDEAVRSLKGLKGISNSNGVDGGVHRPGTGTVTGTTAAATAPSSHGEVLRTDRRFEMLYLVGLGLHDEKDVTVRGMEAIKGSERVYLEAYTSILGVGKERLEAFYGKEVVVADRDMVEMDSDEILRDADKVDVAFLVVGDPFGATTHSDLLLRADALSIPYTVIHNASVMNAVGALGLALYNYGQTVSIPFFTDSWRPDSWLERVRENLRLGLHTLCLLDIKVKEQSEENLARGRKIFEPPRYMSVPCAISQLLSLLEDELSSSSASSSAPAATDASSSTATAPVPDAAALDPSTTLAISASRVGAPSQRFVAGTLAELSQLDEDAFGGPLHSFVIVGRRFHALERDFAVRWAVDQQRWNEVSNGVYGVRD